MFKAILVYLSIFTLMQSKCGDGCLRCRAPDTCLYCDLNLGYRLKSGGCEQFELLNCLYADEQGRCLACNEGFYLDKITYKCVVVVPESKIDNCQHYSAPKICSVCKPGHVINAGKCQVLETGQIDNCLYQDNAGNCLECKENYLRSIDRKSCIVNPESISCASYDNISCLNCKEQYIYNQNAYLAQLYGFSTKTQLNILSETLYNLKNNIIDTLKYNVCQKTSVLMCKNFETFNKCKECFAGFFLQSGKCIKNPIDSVPYCEIYSSLTNCVGCINKYKLVEGVCQPVKRVEHCERYYGGEGDNRCVKCEEGFFVSGGSRCIERVFLEIPNCNSLEDDKDGCDHCFNFYMRSADRKSCLLMVDNCRFYNPPRRLDEQLICLACEKGYFLTMEGNCQAGVVENCVDYQRTTGKCLRCASKFFLEREFCAPHETIDGCVEYHPLLRNSCLQCNFERQKLHKLNECQAVDIISNCEDYAPDGSCHSCEDLYYKTSNMCELIPPAENCMQRNGPLCGKCLPDFSLVEGACRDPLDFIVLHCNSDNVDGTTTYQESQCYNCEANAIPMNYRDSFVCVENDYMQYIQGVVVSLDCLQWERTPDSFVCKKCVDGKQLNDGQCVTDCPGNKTLYIQTLKQFNRDGDDIAEKISVEATNVCHTELPNCMKAAPSLLQDHLVKNLVQYECVECRAGNLEVIEFNDRQSMIRSSANLNFSPVSFFPAIRCQTLDTDFLLGELNLNNDGIVNCEYYVKIGEIYACNKCVHGYHGIVVDFIHKCAKYESESKCIECEQGFYLRSPYECKAVDEITFCVSYDAVSSSNSCLLCDTEYFLFDNQTCTPRQQSLSVDFCTATVDADTCTCVTGYKLDTATTPFRCIKMPNNCVAGTINLNSVDCTQCDASISYLSGTSCMLGSQDCDTYQASANLCTVCPNSKFLSAGRCYDHGTINRCETYSQGTQDLCEACDMGSMLFEVVNKCAQVDDIANCKDYKTVTTCMTCEDTFRLQNISTTCYSIPAEDHCVVQVPWDKDSDGTFDENDFDNNDKFVYTCNQCEANYYRVPVDIQVTWLGTNSPVTLSVNQCVDYIKPNVNHCASSNINGTIDIGTGECIACEEGYLTNLFSSQGSFQCLNRTYLTTSKTVNNIDNCRVLTYEGTDTWSCVECVYPYKIESGICVAECTSSTESNLLIDIDPASATPSITRVISTSICQDNTALAVANCETYTEERTSISVLKVCIKCKTGFIPVTTTLIGFYINSVFHGSYQTQKRATSPFPTNFMIESCVDTTGAVAFEGSLNHLGFIENCEFYKLLGNDTNDIYGCQKCKLGFTGPIIDSIVTPGTYFFESCSAITDCDTSVLDDGLFAQSNQAAFIQFGSVAQFYSCYKCTTGVPVMFYEANVNDQNAITFNRFILSNYNSFPLNDNTQTTQIDTAGGSDVQTQCLDVDTTFSQETVRTTEIPNCALWAYNILAAVGNANANKSTVADALGDFTGLSLVCTACNPGYAPTPVTQSNGTTEHYFAIAACTEIVNCDTSDATKNTWFNSCENCTHLLNFSIGGIIDWRSCVPMTLDLAQCYLANEIGDCFLCNKGYQLSADNSKCYKVEIETCSYFYTNQFDSFISKSVLLSNLYFQFNEELSANGCTECADNVNYIIAGYDTTTNTEYKDTVCLNRDVITFDVTYPDVTIPDCKNYQYDVANTTYVCWQCRSGFILTEALNCTAEDLTLLPDCIKANIVGGSVCMQCTDNTFVNVGGHCRSVINFSTCESFDNAASFEAQQPICLQCALGYHMGTSCEAIDGAKFPQCGRLNPAGDACSECLTNYKMVNLVSGTYCFPLDIDTSGSIDYDPNCLEVENSSSEFQNKQLKCKTCESNYILSTLNIQFTKICLQFLQSMVSQCGTYDKPTDSDTLISKSLDCLNCLTPQRDSYFFDGASKTCISRSAIPECSLYVTDENKCESCVDNYKLSDFRDTCIPLPGAFPDNIPTHRGYMQTCMSLDTCDEEVFYQGLPHKLNSIVSCHQCKTTSNIPLIAVKGGSPYETIFGLQEFGFDITSGQRLDLAAGMSSNQCFDPTSILPTNCGLGMINANSELDHSNSNQLIDVDRNMIAYICVACKPGFKATGSTDLSETAVEFMIGECNAITNCETSEWFNYCSQCASFHAYLYTDTGVDYGTCIDSTLNPACFAVRADGECALCAPGYYMNKDGFCELIHPPRCGYGEFRFREFYLAPEYNTGFYLSRKGLGCTLCDEGYVGLYMPNDLWACTESAYHSNELVLDTSRYLFQCVNYSVDKFGRLYCVACAQEFVLTSFGKCVSAQNIPNCELAQNAEICLRCSKTTVLINNECLEATIGNCFRYAEFNNSYQICVLCENGYYLRDNACTAGEITNCEEYETEDSCNRCALGFAPVYADDGRTECMRMEQRFNCNKIDFHALEKGLFRCLECASNKFVINYNIDQIIKTECNLFQPIENCIKYDVQYRISTSSYACVECSSDFFLSQGACQIRLVRPANCVELSDSLDKCHECEDGYFLNTEGTACIPFPDGITNCRVYLSKDNCRACVANHYLENHECLPIPELELIENCVYYLDKETCDICDTGFLVNEGKCDAILAQNCATYNNASACNSCSPGSGFLEENGIVNCQSASLSNCLVNEFVSPYKCTTCESGFYPDGEGKCAKSSIVIANCIQYDSTDTCSQCDSTSALASDKKSCDKSPSVLSLIDTNCVNSQIRENPVCNTCKPGNVFVNGQCTECKDNGLAEGCFNCDPQNLERCLMCKSDFYMIGDGRCIENGKLPPNPDGGDGDPDGGDNNGGDPDNGGNPDNGGDNGSSIKIVMSLIVSLFLILV